MLSIKLKPTPYLHYDIHIDTPLEYLGCIKLLSLAPLWMHLSLMSATVSLGTLVSNNRD